MTTTTENDSFEAKLKALAEQLEASKADWDRHMKAWRESSEKEWKALRREARERGKELDRRIGELVNSHGETVEALIDPAVRDGFEELGYRDLRYIGPRKRHRGGETMEYDALYRGIEPRSGRDTVLACEAKSRLTAPRVAKHLRKLNRFFEFFEDLRACQVIGVVAGARLDEGIRQHANRQGLYLLVPSGSTFTLEVPPGFVPRIWTPGG